MNKHIKIFNDFLSENDCSRIISSYEGAKWRKDKYGQDQLQIDDQWVSDYYDLMLPPIFDVYHMDIFSNRDFDFNPMEIELLRYWKGYRRWIHAASLKDRGTISLSTLIFLNEGHDGGDVVFPDQELVITPKTGRLVIFPASYLFPHEVTTLRSKGPRYAMVRGYRFKAGKYDRKNERIYSVSNSSSVREISQELVSSYKRV